MFQNDVELPTDGFSITNSIYPQKHERDLIYKGWFKKISEWYECVYGTLKMQAIHLHLHAK